VRDRWLFCRDGEGGLRHLPGPGGVGQQSAWLLDAIEQFERVFQDAKPRR
jgi:hypothetical protein